MCTSVQGISGKALQEIEKWHTFLFLRINMFFFWFSFLVECTVHQVKKHIRVEGDGSWHARWRKWREKNRKSSRKGKCFVNKDINGFCCCRFFFFFWIFGWNWLVMVDWMLNSFADCYGDGTSSLAQNVDDVLFGAALQLLTVDLCIEMNWILVFWVDQLVGEVEIGQHFRVRQQFVNFF